MAPEHRVLGEHHVIANDGVVANMSATHQVGAISHARLAAGLGGYGAVNGSSLANDDIVSDDKPRPLSIEFGMLRRSSYISTGPDTAIAPDDGVAVDMAALQHLGSGGDLDAFLDDAVGADGYIVRQFSPAIDDCGWMDLGHRKASVKAGNFRAAILCAGVGFHKCEMDAIR